MAYFWDGKVLFSGGAVAMHQDCCCESEPVHCEGCEDNLGPAEFFVEIENAPAENRLCSNGSTVPCGDFEGAWVLPFQSSSSSSCIWRLVLASGNQITVFMSHLGGGDWRLSVQRDIVSGFCVLIFREDFEGQIPCRTFNAHSVPILGTVCPGTTCKITAL